MVFRLFCDISDYFSIENTVTRSGRTLVSTFLKPSGRQDSAIGPNTIAGYGHCTKQRPVCFQVSNELLMSSEEINTNELVMSSSQNDKKLYDNCTGHICGRPHSPAEHYIFLDPVVNDCPLHSFLKTAT